MHYEYSFAEHFEIDSNVMKTLKRNRGMRAKSMTELTGRWIDDVPGTTLQCWDMSSPLTLSFIQLSRSVDARRRAAGSSLLCRLYCRELNQRSFVIRPPRSPYVRPPSQIGNLQIQWILMRYYTASYLVQIAKDTVPKCCSTALTGVTCHAPRRFGK